MVEAMGDRSGKESKKENRSTRVHQGRCEGTTGPFESEDANNQNHEADQKNGRFVASESAQARHRSRASPITEFTAKTEALRTAEQALKDNGVVMPFAGLEGVRRGCRAVVACLSKLTE